MKSPLLQEIPAPRYRIVEGTHKTGCAGTRVTVSPFYDHQVLMNMSSQTARAADLRELAELFTALADALDGGATA